ncbi:hypothetical protein NL676_020381 [Syzygium grande]|nr:hypothetical protein NL676_020381 [Syzygium grande]
MGPNIIKYKKILGSRHALPWSSLATNDGVGGGRRSVDFLGETIDVGALGEPLRKPPATAPTSKNPQKAGSSGREDRPSCTGETCPVAKEEEEEEEVLRRFWGFSAHRANRISHRRTSCDCLVHWVFPEQKSHSNCNNKKIEPREHARIQRGKSVVNFLDSLSHPYIVKLMDTVWRIKSYVLSMSSSQRLP